MSRSVDVTVPADPDEDNCLAAAVAAYVEDHPDLADWDLSPRWAVDEGGEMREAIVLTVPAWAVRQ